ncbi:MAG: ABC transporter permease [Candidatus Bipolaricaulota bacterium]|nr:ABC transporter permease [Candidatus Bipolaricaulota bacterium]MDW8127224.1 ABC transporter permease [Candidatus Bipolaricaulota bacterium]
MRVFCKNKLGLLGLGILALFAAMAGVAPLLPALDPIYHPIEGMDPRIFTASPPSWRHPLGTDAWGRDLLSQLLHGAQVALLVGIVAAATAVLIGTGVGLVAGYLGGGVDFLLMRLVDVLLILPLIPLIMLLSAFLGRGMSIWNVVLIIGLLGWPGVARVIRAQVLTLRARPFVEAARAYGAGELRIIVRHIAPGVLPLSFVYMSFGANSAVFLEAALSFIGFGDPRTMSWGMMLQWCFKTGHTFSAPYWILPPGLAISALCLAFYLIGRAMEEIIYPQLRGWPKV